MNTPPLGHESTTSILFLAPRARGTALAALLGALFGATLPAAAQLRVVNYNIAQLRGDALALEDVFAAMAADDKPGFATAPAAIVMQEVRAADKPILQALVAAGIPGATYAAATYTTSAFEDGNGGAQLLLYRTDLLSEVVASHKDLNTGGGRFSDRWQLTLDGYDSPLASIWLYGTHLKAGSASSDLAERLVGAQLLRDDADLLPATANVLFCGDFNLSSNSEAAYTEFLIAGPAQCVDPLGSGSWSGAGNALKHTQSPRDIAADGLIGGGMDDRFDFQLISTELDDGDGLSMMPGTYRAFGNDGQHFNSAINSGNNSYYPGDIPRSNALADDLFDGSDHIPVIVDFRLPGVLSAAMTDDFGRVIQGGAATVDVLVANVADVLVPGAVDPLDYEVTGLAGLVGTISGVVGALPETDIVPLPVDTSALGFVKGAVAVTTSSQAAQNPSYVLFTTGTVIRAANASLSSDDDVDLAELELVYSANSGVQSAAIAITNLFHDSDQALLDVDALQGLEAPATLAAPLPTNIGSVPGVVTLAVDTSVPPGVYGAAVTILCSDEDLPGASTSLLGLLLTIAIEEGGNPADLNGDGVVDGADLGALLAAWGACPGCAADLNHDGVVDGADLGALLAAWR